MGQQRRTPKTHHLFLRVVAMVSQSTKPMTVADIGKALGLPADVVAQCVGLHLFLESKCVGEMMIPPPADYRVPKIDDVISRKMLEPKRLGRVLDCRVSHAT